jgi:hypothetical protein
LLISSHPSGQKGFFGHSNIFLRVSVFFSGPDLQPGAAAPGALTFINTGSAVQRYDAVMASWQGNCPPGAMPAGCRAWLADLAAHVAAATRRVGGAGRRPCK